MSVSRRPALVVPDEATWTMAGHDPAAHGLLPVASAETARAVLAPDLVPKPLESALLAEWRRSGGLHAVPGPHPVALRGRPLHELIANDIDGQDSQAGGGHGEHNARGGHDEHAEHESRVSHGVKDEEASGHGGHEGHGGREGHGGHDAHEGHGGHDHHDMMAIVGEPSADGLVMDPIDFRFGPLTPLLPGGLTVEVSLDGDVVADARVSAGLRASVDGPENAPDALAPVAWLIADAVAREVAGGAASPARVQWQRLAAVELERALSHVAWLRSLGRVLGWPLLIEAAQRAVGTLVPLHGLQAMSPGGSDLGGPRQAIDALTRLTQGRRFAARTQGRGSTSGDVLAGSNGRAARGGVDARSGDPLYRELGFEPVVREGGDAHARALVRVHEVEASLELARRALERAASAVEDGTPEAFATAAGARVEGPRGPLLVSRSEPEGLVLRAAPGADVALEAAGEAMVGLEWSAALVVLTSFDLSPWRVGS